MTNKANDPSADEDLIVGSGPSGVAAAHALLARGRKVRMLDVGGELEPANAERAARMGAVEPGAWRKEDVDSLLAPPEEESNAAMRPYGSDFALRDTVGFFGRGGAPAGIGLRPSFARGGLSNGWGSAVTPYRLKDITDWPKEAQELAPHYAAAARILPIAAGTDDLADIFSMWSPEHERALPSSPQASELLKRLAKRADALRRQGIAFGRARQAVAEGCRTCGLCLHGCPYRLIFNASRALDGLIGRDGFTYEPRRYVQRFEESENGVTVVSREPDSGAFITHKARRLFLAAGVLPTAKIMLSSVGAPGEKLILLDSQYMLMPMLHAWSHKGDVAQAPQHSLTQVFLEIDDPEISEESAHAQLYTYNDHFEGDLLARFDALGLLAAPLARAFSRRLIVAQAFLHSRLSGSMAMSLEAKDGEARLKLEPVENPASLPALARLKQRLLGALAPSGVFALTPFARMDAIGSSFHCGGSFPMRDAPQGLEADVLGRPAGLERVHIVDASVLPSIPATTITFSVMANASRIASSAPL